MWKGMARRWLACGAACRGPSEGRVSTFNFCGIIAGLRPYIRRTPALQPAFYSAVSRCLQTAEHDKSLVMNQATGTTDGYIDYSSLDTSSLPELPE
jgi:hypothetical protein